MTDRHGIKRMYNARISRFIGASLADIIQLCRQPAVFNILADSAAWFPECPGDNNNNNNNNNNNADGANRSLINFEEIF